MPKLLAIASTLTTLAVLAISATAFAGKASQAPIVHDHRHAATPPAANSPPPAAARTTPWGRSKLANPSRAFKRADPPKRPNSAPGNSVPSGGQTTEIK